MFRGGQLQILVTDDIVPVEDAPGLMAGNFHYHPLRYPGSHHVSYSRSPEVMEEFGRDFDLVPISAFFHFPKASLDASCLPCIPKISDRLSITMEDMRTTELSL